MPKFVRDANQARLLREAASSTIEPLESRFLLAASGGTGGNSGGDTGGDTGTGGAVSYPTATPSIPLLTTWGPSYTFTVTYLSNKRIRTSQIDNNDVRIAGPNGYSRPARLVGYVDNVKQVIAKYKVSTPNSVWNAADNGTYSVIMNSRQVSDGGNNYAAGGKIGRFIAWLPAYPTDTAVRQTAPLGALDVTQFGAVPNDGQDDWRNIQAAISALPHPTSVPNGTTPIGGTIWFPAGTFEIIKPLTLASGMILRGSGSGTILNYKNTDTNSAAIRLTSYFSNGIVARAGVEDMTINTVAAKGIQSTSDTSDLVGISLERLTFNTFGTAIDLRQNDVYQSDFRDITINNPGSSALWLTISKDNGNSAINRIEDVVIQGAVQSGFVSDTALVVLAGDIAVNELSIGDTGAPVTPIAVNDGNISFSNLTLPNTTATGVLMAMNSYRIDIDQLPNLSSTRRVTVANIRQVHIGKVSLAGSSSLSSALSVDSSSHVTIDQLYSANGSDFDPLSVMVEQNLASAVLSAPAPAIRSGEIAAVSSSIANVASFGASADDGQDDTAAIQAAIDSLPRGNGVPNSDPQSIVGGTVTLPTGVFNTSAALRIPSGVWLQGQGAGTVIYSTAPAGSQAIQLVSGALPGNNIGAGVSDLSIYTTDAAGIRSDPALTGGLYDFRASDIVLSAGGIGIDLRPARAFHSNIDNILISNPGSDAVWIGDDAGYSADNHLRNVQINGSARSNFSGDRALFVFTGQNTIDDLWIEQSNAVILPLYVSGVADIHGMWLEYPVDSLPNSITAQFQNCTRVTIDRLYSIDYLRKLQLNNANVNIGYINIAGRSDLLYDCLSMDNSSTLNIGTVNAIFDAGMLDNPRVTVGGVFNQTSGNYTSTSIAQSNNGNIISDFSTWQIQWGDSLGSVQGSIFQASDGVHIIINSNPNRRPSTIYINLNVSAGLIGRQSIARWHIDGPAAPTMFTSHFNAQYYTRALNTGTAVVSPGTLQAGDQLLIMLPYTVTSGEFVISDLAIIPI